jgi:hypothetical protein
MKHVKCCECGRTQRIEELLPAARPTPYETRRHRWFFVVATGSVVCGGSHRGDGIDDGKDWCLVQHFRKHELDPKQMDVRYPGGVIHTFFPGIDGKVPTVATESVFEGDGLSG